MKTDKKTERDGVELKFGVLEIKDEEKGEVEAIVATLDVVDKDGDILRPGAIKSGTKVLMSDYRHSVVFGQKPAGKGTLVVRDDKLVFRGRTFLKTIAGRDVFETLKELGPDSEWSFGFLVKGWEEPNDAQRKQGVRRIITKAEAVEASPVFRGAGIGTRTLAVKSEGDPTPDEEPPEEPPDHPPTPTPEELLEAKKKADAELETKAAADRAAVARQARAVAAVEDFHRVQKTLKRLGVK